MIRINNNNNDFTFKDEEREGINERLATLENDEERETLGN